MHSNADVADQCVLTQPPPAVQSAALRRYPIRVLLLCVSCFSCGCNQVTRHWYPQTGSPSSLGTTGSALQLGDLGPDVHIFLTCYSLFCMHFASNPAMAFARAHAPHNGVLARRTMLRPDTASSLNKASNQGQWTSMLSSPSQSSRLKPRLGVGEILFFYRAR
jgi:hypothetical protein